MKSYKIQEIVQTPDRQRPEGTPLTDEVKRDTTNRLKELWSSEQIIKISDPEI